MILIDDKINVTKQNNDEKGGVIHDLVICSYNNRIVFFPNKVFIKQRHATKSTSTLAGRSVGKKFFCRCGVCDR